MGGGVEDDGGPVLHEDGADAGLVEDIGDQGLDDVAVAELDELLLDLEKLDLGLIEEQKAGGLEGGDLAAEFAADTAAGAGDHDDSVFQDAGNLVHPQVHGVASEEVLDAHVAQLADTHVARSELVNAGDGDVLNAVFLEETDDFR
jgi:hypothetical protein